MTMDQLIKLGELINITAALEAVFSKDEDVVISLHDGYDGYMEFYAIKNGVEYVFKIRKGCVDSGED